MSQEAIELVARVSSALLADNVVAVLEDEEQSEAALATLAEDAAPDFECVLVAPQYTGSGGRLTFSGVEGFREAWLEWLAPFETYSLEIEDLIDAGDRVVTLARQSATTRVGGVRMEEDTAAVWTVRDGKLASVEFHLDRDRAMKAAGLAD
jgi:ketosteroid isomerase-like protein